MTKQKRRTTNTTAYRQASRATPDPTGNRAQRRAYDRLRREQDGRARLRPEDEKPELR